MAGDRPQLLVLPVRLGLSVAILAFAAAVAGSCDGVTGFERSGDPLVQTDAGKYTLRKTPEGRGLEVEISYRYENRTDTRICMAHCSGAFAVGLVDESGDLVWSPVLPSCLAARAIAVPAGKTYHGTLRVFHGLAPNYHPRFEGTVEGTYRIDIVSAHWNGESCLAEQVPRELRISNRFKLERE